MAVKHRDIVGENINAIIDNENFEKVEKIQFLGELQESYSYKQSDYQRVQEAISSLDGVSGRPLGASMIEADKMCSLS